MVLPSTIEIPTSSQVPVPATNSAAPLIPLVIKSPPPEIARNHWFSSANFHVHNQSEASNFS